MTTAQIKNAFTSLGEVDASMLPSSLELKLAITNSAVRYFILSRPHQQIIFFGNYTLHHINKNDDLAFRFEKIVERDEILQLGFGTTVVGLDTPYSLAPAELSYMLKGYTQRSQKFSGQELDLIFDNNSEVESAAGRLLKGPALRHLNSTFIALLPQYLDENSDRLFVNVSQTYVDIIRYDSTKKLQLMNRYEFQTATDFIYYVLLCCEDFKIDREKTELILAGEVDIQSKIYDMCYRYFRNISFIQKPESMHFSRAFDMFPKHLHFNLYNLGV